MGQAQGLHKGEVHLDAVRNRRISTLLKRVFVGEETTQLNSNLDVTSSVLRSKQRLWIPAEHFHLHKGKVGAGTMGQVIAADMDGTAVALKHTNALWFEGIDSEEAMRAFRHEVNLLLALSHPNIVRFYGVTLFKEDPKSDEKLYMVTELCTPGGLDTVLNRYREIRDREKGNKFTVKNIARRKVREKLATRWVFQMCSALSYLHRTGLLHGDIKPANILIDGKDHQSVKLCDFGLAAWVSRSRGNSVTSNGARRRSVVTRDRYGRQRLSVVAPDFINQRFGTPSFMAPELLNEQIGARLMHPLKTDVWAFGIVVWCIVTLQSEGPFDQMTMYQIQRKSRTYLGGLSDMIPALSDDAPEHLSSIISACLKENPLDRPSFEEISALLRHLNKERLHRESTARRLVQEDRKFSRESTMRHSVEEERKFSCSQTENQGKSSDVHLNRRNSTSTVIGRTLSSKRQRPVPLQLQLPQKGLPVISLKGIASNTTDGTLWSLSSQLSSDSQRSDASFDNLTSSISNSISISDEEEENYEHSEHSESIISGEEERTKNKVKFEDDGKTISSQTKRFSQSEERRRRRSGSVHANHFSDVKSSSLEERYPLPFTEPEKEKIDKSLYNDLNTLLHETKKKHNRRIAENHRKENEMMASLKEMQLHYEIALNDLKHQKREKTKREKEMEIQQHERERTQNEKYHMLTQEYSEKMFEMNQKLKHAQNKLRALAHQNEVEYGHKELQLKNEIENLKKERKELRKFKEMKEKESQKIQVIRISEDKKAKKERVKEKMFYSFINTASSKKYFSEENLDKLSPRKNLDPEFEEKCSPSKEKIKYKIEKVTRSVQERNYKEKCTHCEMMIADIKSKLDLGNHISAKRQFLLKTPEKNQVERLQRKLRKLEENWLLRKKKLEEELKFRYEELKELKWLLCHEQPKIPKTEFDETFHDIYGGKKQIEELTKVRSMWKNKLDKERKRFIELDRMGDICNALQKTKNIASTRKYSSF
eukprot:g580.t1